MHIHVYYTINSDQAMAKQWILSMVKRDNMSYHAKQQVTKRTGKGSEMPTAYRQSDEDELSIGPTLYFNH